MYKMPPEWSEHQATLLTWPTSLETWQEGLESARNSMYQLAMAIAEFEKVILVYNYSDRDSIYNYFSEEPAGIDLLNIPVNDSWVRDYGPCYVLSTDHKKYIVNWGYNAWGGKYPPWDDDASFKKTFSNLRSEEIVDPDMILEGGSIDVNGEGNLLTTESCLLNKNRNPHLSKADIENNLAFYLGADNVIWLKSGIAGDDTDGHIDDFCRFISKDKIIISAAKKGDVDYELLEENYQLLINHPEILKKQITIHKIPMPEPYYLNNERLPLSYANFYFCNRALILPSFGVPEDKEAYKIFEDLIPDRKIVQVPSLPFLRGLGGIHCLTQQVI